MEGRARTGMMAAGKDAQKMGVPFRAYFAEIE